MKHVNISVTFDLCIRSRRKGKYGQKQSQKCYISHIWEKPICTKVCLWGDVPNVSRCARAKFQNEILKGYMVLWGGGGKNFHFPTDFYCIKLLGVQSCLLYDRIIYLLTKLSNDMDVI